MSREFVRASMEEIGATLWDRDATHDHFTIGTAGVEMAFYKMRHSIPFGNLYSSRGDGGLTIYYDRPKTPEAAEWVRNAFGDGNITTTTAEQALMQIMECVEKALAQNEKTVPGCVATLRYVRARCREVCDD